MPYSWKNKTAFITGASSGLGASFSRFLAEKGLRLILTARRKENLQKITAEIQASGGRADYFPADISKESERESLCKYVNSFSDGIDVLINNAGFGWYGYFAEMPWTLARQMAQVNMVSAAFLTRKLLPGMLSRKSGHIINIGSIAGGLPNQGIALYAASKAFLDAFTTSLARELRGSGLHASVMRLGPGSAR